MRLTVWRDGQMPHCGETLLHPPSPSDFCLRVGLGSSQLPRRIPDSRALHRLALCWSGIGQGLYQASLTRQSSEAFRKVPLNWITTVFGIDVNQLMLLRHNELRGRLTIDVDGMARRETSSTG